jgi:hypothetical protein
MLPGHVVDVAGWVEQCQRAGFPEEALLPIRAAHVLQRHRLACSGR